MKVLIEKRIIKIGGLTGKSGIIVDFQSKKGVQYASMPDVVGRIIELGGDYSDLFIQGNLSEEPEIKTLVIAMEQLGRNITFCTNATEDLSPVRHYMNIHFILIWDWSNPINGNSIPLLNNMDSIYASVQSKENFTSFVQHIRTHRIYNPELVISFNEAGEEEVIKLLIERYKQEFMEDKVARTRLSGVKTLQYA